MRFGSVVYIRQSAITRRSQAPRLTPSTADKLPSVYFLKTVLLHEDLRVIASKSKHTYVKENNARRRCDKTARKLRPAMASGLPEPLLENVAGDGAKDFGRNRTPIQRHILCSARHIQPCAGPPNSTPIDRLPAF